MNDSQQNQRTAMPSTMRRFAPVCGILVLVLSAGVVIGVSQYSRMQDEFSAACETVIARQLERIEERQQEEYLETYSEEDSDAEAARQRFSEVLSWIATRDDSDFQPPERPDRASAVPAGHAAASTLLSARAQVDCETGLGATSDEASGSGIRQGTKSERTNPVSLLENAAESRFVSEAEVDFWSFQPLRQPRIPDVADSDWPRNPIDQFVLARLEAAGIVPEPEAPWSVLRRRLSFDLTGLPPEVGDDVSDNPDSLNFERQVTQLMSRPAFGERWARVWLDLARYADSNGYEEDELRPHAWPYRDFVIWAMNNDLPFDRFVRWQVAGDEIAPTHPLAIAATGFLTAGPYNTFLPQEEERYDELDDIVSTLFSATLGLSVGCARCHDHRYDPIPMRDYYGLIAVFSGTARTHRFLASDQGQAYRVYGDPIAARKAEIREIRRARIKEDNISELDYFTEEEKNLLRQPVDPDNARQVRLISLCERCLLIQDDYIDDDIEPLPADKDRFDRLTAEIDELKKKLPQRPTRVLALTGSSVTTVPILPGGNLRRAGEAVGPGFLTALTAGRPVWDEDVWRYWARNRDDARPRTALAHWLTDLESGSGALLARVIVNRLWQHHFGRGLVETSSDFGMLGSEPSHPELLEWLAWELVESGWSLKHIHQLMVTSATWRQAVTTSRDKVDQDPSNRLFGRRTVQRLTAEMLRDAMLTAGGTLNMTMYGPGFKQPIPRSAVYSTQDDAEDTWPMEILRDRPALWRRSVYQMHRRTMPVPMMTLFDAPTAGFSCSDRKETTVPTQALVLWNAPFVRRQAERLADRIIREAGAGQADWSARAVTARAFTLTVGRLPSRDEAREIGLFLGQANTDADRAARLQTLQDFCHVLLMSNEFLYVE